MYRKLFKRPMDITLSFLAILVLSPILILFAILVRIKIGSPIFFKQYRPGKNWNVFKLYKFRSMTNKRDENGELLPDSERLTKFGKLLRKTSIDELPQLWNILKGDMSIVGPRPRLVKDMVFYEKEVLSAYSIRPGLTGLAQVNGRNSNSWEEVFKFDKKYYDKITFIGDMKIIFKTAFSIFKHRGAAEGAVKEDYQYGSYLLRRNMISEEEYVEGSKNAEIIIDEKIKINEFMQKIEEEKEKKKEINIVG